jgi:hypothetical protein
MRKCEKVQGLSAEDQAVLPFLDFLKPVFRTGHRKQEGKEEKESEPGKGNGMFFEFVHKPALT